MDDGILDFDQIYSRVGTECVKWDEQIERFGESKILAGMGIADMDFRAAPCIADEVAKRCEHENRGYMVRRPESYVEAIVDRNRERHGNDVEPGSIERADGVHPGLGGALRRFSAFGQRTGLRRQQNSCGGYR